MISAGILKVVDNAGQELFFPVKSGFLEVKEGNQVRCIVEE